MTGQVGEEPAPQLPCPGVEQDGGFVVVAVRAQRTAEPDILVVVADGAGDVTAVRAGPPGPVPAGAAGQHRAAPLAARVDGTERGRGEGGEHARVLGNRFRYALASGQARADELAGIALVGDRAGRAGRLAAVTAGDMQDTAGFGIGGVGAPGLAGSQVDSGDRAAQPDGPGTGGGGGELAFPAA